MRRIIILLLLAAVALAWNGDTHRAIGADLCAAMNCSCPADMENGSTAPDLVFHDTARHHYYDVSWACPTSNWTCPTKDDFVAMDWAERWLANASAATGCEREYDIAVASHYFFDSMVFWHRVQNEDSDTHSGWEGKVGDQWGPALDYCGNGACVKWSDYQGWKTEFLAKIGVNATVAPTASGDLTLAGGQRPGPGWLEMLINFFMSLFERWF